MIPTPCTFVAMTCPYGTSEWTILSALGASEINWWQFIRRYLLIVTLWDMTKNAEMRRQVMEEKRK